jgi:hypothetical protein
MVVEVVVVEVVVVGIVDGGGREPSLFDGGDPAGSCAAAAAAVAARRCPGPRFRWQRDRAPARRQTVFPRVVACGPSSVGAAARRLSSVASTRLAWRPR